ncbi:MAG: PKD domain-containing protein, partial [Flavobacteriales bacterium]
MTASVLGIAPQATFTENRGQWPEQVLYRALIPGGALFVERSAFTYVLFSNEPLRHHGQDQPAEDPGERTSHAYRVHFEGGEASGAEGSLKQAHYENYFLGNDPTHWGTGCGVFGEVLLKNVWPGIDLRLSGKEGIKYEFIVAPGVDAAIVRLRYEGQDGLRLKQGALHVQLTTREVVEESPVAFTRKTSGTRFEQDEVHPLDCSYVLDGDVLGFLLDAFKEHEHELIIDPVLTFSSYSGSAADNFGFTATYDSGGHLYGGGIVFGVGYPETLGVVQSNFAGDIIDIGISKFSPDGSALVWSTYLGGSQGNESPHSMVVNAAGELYVMGVTGSPDFPVTPGCMDASFSPGPPVNFVVFEGYVHNNGSDAIIAHFSSDATQLLGSTFIGGSDSDGLNLSPALDYNYGDPFRGEIILDAQERPVMVTSTRSIDMPISANAPQPTPGGGQDGYACLLDPGLTTLLWGTYYGGSADDAAFGIQQAGDGRLYITGGTQSTNLPMTGIPYHASGAGGTDGYVVSFAADGSALLAATYLGTGSYDQCYFVQIDLSGGVYVVGQTRGPYPVSGGVYANPNGSQFIHKLSSDLSTSIWSTRIGTTGTEDISPAAFLVSDCGQIYFSGWGGNTNNFGQPNTSTTNGLPVTGDAYQVTTDGSDFYLMVLAPNAASLAYATFFGGSSSEHVDGGTSRFDKNGSVYQAVCAGCQQLGYPTTPGAWSNTNNSSNCNLGVFKFDLGQAQAVIGISGPSSICFPSTAQFTNNSVGGTDYFWDFGDNSPTSTEEEPSHTYTTEGVFTVTMILTDSSTCVQADTASITITTVPPPVADADTVDPICPGASAQLHASGGDSYQWFPATGLDDPNSADPIATPATSTTYSVIVTATCGSDTATVDVDLMDTQAFAFPDTSVCVGSSVPVGATGGGTYVWTPPGTLSDPTLAEPMATPLDTTMYTVVITTPDGCIVTDSLLVNVFDGPPLPGL